jgi:hypothetical protein
VTAETACDGLENPRVSQSDPMPARGSRGCDSCDSLFTVNELDEVIRVNVGLPPPPTAMAKSVDFLGVTAVTPTASTATPVIDPLIKIKDHDCSYPITPLQLVGRLDGVQLDLKRQA